MRGLCAPGVGVSSSWGRPGALCPSLPTQQQCPPLQVLVERKYMGKMCGLCGNFDGEKTNEFLSEDGR